VRLADREARRSLRTLCAAIRQMTPARA
jgi:hypothetical protein